MNEEESTKKKIEIDIREMTIDDIAAVFHLGEKVFTAQKLPTLYRTWDEFEVVTHFSGDPDLCLVAEYNETIIGFALATIVQKSRAVWKYGYLTWIAVHPFFHRIRIADRLFRRMVDLLNEQGAHFIIVDTEADNTEALKFFRKNGFGNPKEHVYLSLNIKQFYQRKRHRPKEKEQKKTLPGEEGHAGD